MYNKFESIERKELISIDPRLSYFEQKAPDLGLINIQELEAFDQYGKRLHANEFVPGPSLLKMKRNKRYEEIQEQIPLFRSYRNMALQKNNSLSSRFFELLKTIDKIKENHPQLLKDFEIERGTNLPKEIDLNLKSIEDLERKVFKYVEKLEIWADNRKRLHDLRRQKRESDIDHEESKEKLQTINKIKDSALIQPEAIVKRIMKILGMIHMPAADFERALEQNIIYITNSVDGKATLPIQEAAKICIGAYDATRHSPEKQQDIVQKIREIQTSVLLWHSDYYYNLKGPQAIINPKSNQVHHVKFLDSEETANKISKIFGSLPMRETHLKEVLEKNALHIENIFRNGQNIPVFDAARALVRKYERAENGFQDRQDAVEELRFLVKSAYTWRIYEADHKYRKNEDEVKGPEFRRPSNKIFGHSSTESQGDQWDDPYVELKTMKASTPRAHGYAADFEPSDFPVLRSKTRSATEDYFGTDLDKVFEDSSDEYQDLENRKSLSLAAFNKPSSNLKSIEATTASGERPRALRRSSTSSQVNRLAPNFSLDFENPRSSRQYDLDAIFEDDVDELQDFESRDSSAFALTHRSSERFKNSEGGATSSIQRFTKPELSSTQRNRLLGESSLEFDDVQPFRQSDRLKAWFGPE